MDTAPAISVHMAVRKGTPCLAETIDSLAALVGEDIDFGMVDDGSADDTPRLPASWAARDPRVRVETMPAGPGVIPVALNRGLALCRGELIARADADDPCHPERLVRQRARMAAEPDLDALSCDALSCGFHRIDPAGARIGTVPAGTGPDLVRFTALFRNEVLHSGTTMRRAVLKRLGGCDEACWTAQDSDLFARMLSAGGKIDNLAGPLVGYRVHTGSRRNTRGAEGQVLGLTVPTRTQAIHPDGLPADRDVTASVVTASVALHRGRRPPAAEVTRRGLAGLDRIAAVAAGREPPQVVAHFRARVAASLPRQVGWASRHRPLDRLGGRRKAARWLQESGHGA